jgi:predicted metal-dependent HD superfamily phosphohydrolase
LRGARSSSRASGPPWPPGDRVPRPGTLDLGRWTALWSGLGAEGDGLSVFTRLAAAYAEPARVYHTTVHIHDCLAQFDLSRKAARRPEEVEAALWFHDAVYEPARSDNEDRSADLARTALADSGVPCDVADHIAGMVLATRHASIPNDPDVALVCDIDLSILGRTPEVFDRFERQIRREYGWVPEFAYRSARLEILRGFLKRSFIYQTEYFRNRYEVAARANLARAVN